MAKMTKEQTAKFNELYDAVINWGEGEDCWGMFSELSGENGELDKLATCVEYGRIGFFEIDGSYL